MAVSEILLALVAVLGAVIYWCKYNFSYWQRKNIAYIKPLPLIGNTKCVFTQSNSFGLHLADMHNDPTVANAPVVGIYVLHQPALLIRDTELVKTVLIKEFNRFLNRSANSDVHRDPLAANNLFFVKDPYWKKIRQKLSPVFSSGKIKAMYPLMLEIGKELENHLSRFEKTDNSFITDVKEFCALFTTDNIATIAFGIRINSLINPDAEFRTFGRQLFEFNWKRAFDGFIIFFLPKLINWLPVKIFHNDFERYMRHTFEHVISEREKSGQKRNDIIDALLDIKKEAKADGNHFANNNDFLLAQAAVFFSAGFETSASTMSFALYELAKHPDLQKRLRQEILKAFVADNGALTYESINNLEYLDMVVDEVLRIYPVLPFLDREYQSKKGEPDLSLNPYHNFTIPNGMPLYISVYAIHHDPNIWPNPEQFDPERFSKENKKNVNPITYFPFGNGPRSCIGSRIGLLQTKLGLVHILKNHYVELCDNSKKTFDTKAFILSFKEKLNLRIVNDYMYDNTSN